MRKSVDRIGHRYGRLVVFAAADPAIEPTGRSRAMWLCKCDCGNEKSIRGSDLHSGRTRSCGCIFSDGVWSFNLSHGEAKKGRQTPEYRIWAGMIKRCSNENDSSFRHYGGRGIKVCDRWMGSYEEFLSDMGRRPSPHHSIDRYPDNDGPYSPENCRWATKQEQALNKRGTLTVLVGGENVPLLAECKRRGLKYSSIRQRMHRYGWTAQQALDTPIKTRKKHGRA